MSIFSRHASLGMMSKSGKNREKRLQLLKRATESGTNKKQKKKGNIPIMQKLV